MLAHPRHRGDEGWRLVEVLREGEDALDVVCQELRTEEGAAEAFLTEDVHLTADDAEVPVALGGMEHIDGESGSDDLTVGMFLPVGHEGIELVALEVHHREELVHQSFAQPALGILTDGGIGVPAIAAVTAQVVEFAYR